MAKIIGLPKLSPTMEEGTLVAWTKKEGDEVDVDDLLAEVETDKATMEFRSFDRGVLLKILVPEGETLEPDVPVAIIGKAGENIDELLAQVEAAAASVSASESAAVSASEPAPVSASAPVPESVSDARVSVGVSVWAGAFFSSRPPSGSGAQYRSGIRAGSAGRMGGSSSVISTRMLSAVGGAGCAAASVFLRESRRPAACGGRLRGGSPSRCKPFRTTTLRLTSISRPLSDAREAMNAELEAAGRKVSLNDLIIKVRGRRATPGSRGECVLDGQRDPVPPGRRHFDSSRRRRRADDAGGSRCGSQGRCANRGRGARARHARKRR